MPEMMCERCEREPVDCHAYDIRGRTRWLCADCARKLGVTDFFIASKTVRGGGRSQAKSGEPCPFCGATLRRGIVDDTMKGFSITVIGCDTPTCRNFLRTELRKEEMTGGMRGGGRTEKRVTHNPEHEVRERLKKAIREKHGPWAEEADRLFKRLRALRKDLTDAQIMDIVRQEMKKHSKH